MPNLKRSMANPIEKRRPMLGCIADDVTGATDLAINLVQGGMCVVQLLGVPTAQEVAELDADAVVIALKTRSIPKQEAITQSLAALQALQAAGTQRFFFKYCSTFDSTDEGNIGPVAAALMAELETLQTVFCPAFPRNGRTVYQGHLFVHGRPLHESGMEHHPLNPMTDANLVRVLGKQVGASHQVGQLSYDDFQADLAKHKLQELAANDIGMVITDACDDRQLQQLAEVVAELPLVTGGSGIARYLPDAYRSLGLLETAPYVPTKPLVEGRSLIIAGSCSAATQQQVEWMQAKCPSWEVDVEALLRDPDLQRAELIAWAMNTDVDKPLLISSTSTPENVAELQRKHGVHEVAQAIESFFAAVAATLVADHGFAKIVLAGGETSGAVVSQLGVTSLRIGPEISAGVPWTQSLGQPSLALALKSGNFGEEDFFERALRMLL